MELSETNKRILQQKSGGLSDTNRKIYEARQREQMQSLMPLPDLGVGNSTASGASGPTGLPDMFIGNLPKTIFQGTARGFAVAPAAVGEVFGADVGSIDLRQGTWWEKAFFGEGEMSVDTEGKDVLTSFGASEESAAKASAPLVALFAISDLLPGGKAVREGVMGFLGTIAKTTDLKVIEAEMKTIGFSDESVVKWGGEFQNAKNVDDASAIFKQAGEEEKLSRNLDNTPLKTLDDTDPVTPRGNSFKEKVVTTKSKVMDIFKKTDISDKAPSRRALAETKTPTLKQFDDAVDTLRVVDASVDDVLPDIQELRETIRTEPARFSNDVPKTADDIPSGPHDADDFGTNAMVDLENTYKAEQDQKYFESLTDSERAEWDAAYNKNQDELLAKENSVKVGDEVEFFGVEPGLNTLSSKGDYPKKGVVQEIKKNGELIIESNRANIDDVPFENNMSDFDPDISIMKASDVKKVKPKTKLDTVADPVKDNLTMVSAHIQERYGMTAVTAKNVKDLAKTENEVFLELAGHKMGERPPSWVPRHLYDGQLSAELTEILGKGDIPKVHGGRHMELYTAMVDETAKRAGIKVPMQIRKVTDASMVKKGDVLTVEGDIGFGNRGPKGTVKVLAVSEKTGGIKVSNSSENPNINGMEEWLNDLESSGKHGSKTYHKKMPGELAAIDGSGALVQSMRQNTAHPGAPKLAQEPGVSKGYFEPTKDDLNNLFEDASFTEYREKQGRSERMKMGHGNPNDMDWMDDADISFDGDVWTLRANNSTVYNLSERLLGDSWQKVKEKIFDPFDEAKGRFATEVTELNKDLAEYIVKGLGIKRKSKESKWVQLYGEGTDGFTYGQVVKEFGPERAADIKEAAEWFRNTYDELLASRNATRVANDQIAPRKDYFRHFQEMTNIGKLKNSFENPGLTNLSDESLKSIVHKFSFTKAREGTETQIDAVSGMMDYIPQYAYEKHINPEIPKMTAFIDKLKAQLSPPGYINYMEKFADDLAFSYNPIDSAFGEVNGKVAIEVLNYFNSRAKRNAVLLNPGSGFAQAFNLMNVTSEAGVVHSMKGLRDMLNDIGKGENALWRQESDLLRERFMANSARDLSVGFWEKTTDKAGLLISVLDEVVAVSGFYMMRSKGMANGMGAQSWKYADNKVRMTIGGRGIGDVSPIQKSKMMQLFIPFSLEAVNQLQLIAKRAGRLTKDENFGKTVHFLVAAWLMNQYAEKLTGHSVSMDPLGAAIESYNIYTGVEEDKKKKIAGRMVGEVAQGLPMGKYVLSGIQAGSGMTDENRKKYFGDGDPLRYGSAPLLANAIQPFVESVLPDTEDKKLSDKERGALIVEGLFKILPPLGGNQVSKTLEGALNLGDESPEVDRHPGLPGVAQNLLFGKWSPNIQYENAREDIMRDLYHDVDNLYKNGDEATKKALTERLEQMSPKQKEIFQKVAGQEKAIEKKRDIQNMLPTYRAVRAMQAAGRDDKAKEVLSAFTPREQAIFKAAHADFMAEASEIAQGVETDPESLLKEVLDYGYAMGTNPIQSFKAIFQGQHIEGVTGGGNPWTALFFGSLSSDGTVIVRRMPHKGPGGSAEVKARFMKEQGITDASTVKLEHKLPLTLGGNNTLENLELVTTEVHNATTWMEVYLGKALKAELLGRTEAQELIMRYKGYTGEKITREEIMKIVGQDSISKDEYHKGLDDVGSDSWLLSDEDYSKRDDPITGMAQGKRTLEHVKRDRLIESYK